MFADRSEMGETENRPIRRIRRLQVTDIEIHRSGTAYASNDIQAVYAHRYSFRFHETFRLLSDNLGCDDSGILLFHQFLCGFDGSGELIVMFCFTIINRRNIRF